MSASPARPPHTARGGPPVQVTSTGVCRGLVKACPALPATCPAQAAQNSPLGSLLGPGQGGEAREPLIPPAVGRLHQDLPPVLGSLSPLDSSLPPSLGCQQKSRLSFPLHSPHAPTALASAHGWDPALSDCSDLACLGGQLGLGSGCNSRPSAVAAMTCPSPSHHGHPGPLPALLSCWCHHA